MRGPYDDQIAFTRDAGKLAESLLAEGYKSMKIWPFDPFAVKTNGTWISDEDLEAGLEPFRKIRAAVGNRMEILCELHSLWSVPAAVRICQGLEPFHVFWAEDPLCKMDDIQQLQYLRTKTRTPVCGSETPSGLFQEVVRANLATWYQDIATCLPEIRDGAAQMPTAPGLGMELRPDVMKRKDSIIKESTRE